MTDNMWDSYFLEEIEERISKLERDLAQLSLQLNNILALANAVGASARLKNEVLMCEIYDILDAKQNRGHHEREPQ